MFWVGRRLFGDFVALDVLMIPVSVLVEPVLVPPDDTSCVGEVRMDSLD